MSLYQLAKRIESYSTELQDRCAVIELPDRVVLVVADGAGGTGGGAKAAETVVSAVERWVYSEESLDGAGWCDCLKEIDIALAGHRHAGESTAVVAAVGPRGIEGASIGDSEAWIINGSEPNRLTRRQERKPLLGS